MRGRKQKGPRAVVEVVDQVASAADIPAKRADCLRKGAHLDVDPAVLVEMVDRAAAVAAEDA